MKTNHRRIVSNRWTRDTAGRNRFMVRGRLAVELNAADRADFVDMVKIGRRLQRLDDMTPADWIRGNAIDQDVAELVLALVRGWRWADNGYPVPGGDR